MQRVSRRPWLAGPIVSGQELDGRAEPVRNPADTPEVVGSVRTAGATQVDAALAAAAGAQPQWNEAGAQTRAAMLERAADLFEENLHEFVAMCVREAGKTVPDSIAEVREAVDFLRYYAAGARRTSGRRCACRARPARATRCRCTAAACSPASVRGISRSRSSPARSPRRSPRATPWLRSPPSRRR